MKSRPKDKQTIIILGAGFGGLACALNLDRKLRRKAAEVILIDQNPYHVLSPNLYLAGAAESSNRDACVNISTILARTNINFIRDRVSFVDARSRVIHMEQQDLRFDFAVIALGNRTDYFEIPGLKEQALPFKDITDAGKLRFRLHKLLEQKERRPLKLVVGGGGYTGSELAGELLPAVNLLDGSSREEGVEITVIEASPRLLPGLSPKVSDKVASRLVNHGVRVMTETAIRSVDDAELELSGDKRIEYDLLIWTGGVSGRGFDILPGVERDRRGNYLVDQNLGIGHDNVFIVGDLAVFTDPRTGVALPRTATIAIQEGKAVADNIAQIIRGRKPLPYLPRNMGSIIPVVRRYAIADWQIPGGYVVSGRLVFFLHQLIMLRYLLQILPVWHAFGRWINWVRALRRAMLTEHSYIRRGDIAA
jgi:NADH dehydrogenase